MADFIVIYAGRESSEEFSPYLFDILRGDRKVAQIGHDYRGDEHWIREPGEDRISIDPDAIGGGGPEPLALLPNGIRAVERLLEK